MQDVLEHSSPDMTDRDSRLKKKDQKKKGGRKGFRGGFPPARMHPAQHQGVRMVRLSPTTAAAARLPLPPSEINRLLMQLDIRHVPW